MFREQALEITGETMWRPDQIERALDFIADHRLTALVFHEGDLLNRLTFPRHYFQPFSPWAEAPPRRGENVIYNSRAYLRNVMRRSAARGIGFFLEVKELAFPDEILERYPDILHEGRVCPTHPAWPEFVEIRYREVCEDFPDLTGFIVSVGSPEGRASLTARRCGCDRCRATVDSDWHRSIVGSIRRGIGESGQRLVVREFSYNRRDQQAVIDALTQLPEDIEFCVKPYARDYYLPWPDNAALTALPGRTTWLEYDVHGQYYGWGILPVPVVADEARRFQTARAAGVSNTLLRTDWERINGLWCLDAFGQVNLATAAALGREPDTSDAEALAAALHDTGVSDPSLSGEQRGALAELLLQLYPVVIGALYSHGYVYNVSSMIPSGVDHGWWHMAEQNDLGAWDPDAVGRLDVKSVDVVADLVQEKRQAAERFRELYPQLRDWVASGGLRLPDPARLGDVLAWSRDYIDCFVHTGILTVLVEAKRQRGSLTDAEAGALADSLRELTALRARQQELARHSGHSHHVELLMEGERIDQIIADAQSATTA